MLRAPTWCDKIAGGYDYYYGDEDPLDGRGHGTSCAHIAGALTSNDNGIAGIAGGWGYFFEGDNGAVLYALKIFADTYEEPFPSTEMRVNAIREAGHPDYFNCDVINCSWGYSRVGPMPTPERLAILIGYLAGASFVASSGNSDQYSQPNYPSSFDDTWVTSVGSYGPTGCRCDDIHDCNYVSNYLRDVDLLAPGYLVPTVGISGYIPEFGGTSAAAPHVSGSIALIRSLVEGLQNEDTEWILKYSAWDPPGEACGGTGADGNNWTHDLYYGHGELRLSRAIERLHFPLGDPEWKLIKHTSTGNVESSLHYTNPAMHFIGDGPLDGRYGVECYDVRMTVDYSEVFKSIPYVWGLGGPSTIGWSAASPSVQEGYCRLVPGSQTETGCELQTFVYWITDLEEWYPCNPENVELQYRLWGITKDYTPNGPSSPKYLIDLPNNIKVVGNYPNPFNSSTSIELEIPNRNFVKITVYDILGNKVHVICNKTLASGRHKVRWDGKNIDGIDVVSGIYFYNIEVNNKTFIEKMVLIR